jgi:nucleoside-diphosphate-sugar epimerase
VVIKQYDGQMSRSIGILGCGWLGIPLARHFIEKGYRVKGSTTTESKLDALKAYGIEPYLVRLGVPEDDVQRFFDVEILMVMVTSKDVHAFERLIGLLAASPVQKVIFVSSTSVYGPSDRPVVETDPVLDTPLAQTERLFMHSNAFRTTVVRFGGLFGYDRKPGRFFRSGRVIKDPDNVVNLIHRDDCIGIIDRIIELDVWGEVFNGTTDTHPTKRELYSKAARDLGIDPPRMATDTIQATKLVSNHKVHEVLGYTFRYPDLMQAVSEAEGEG